MHNNQYSNSGLISITMFVKIKFTLEDNLKEDNPGFESLIPFKQ